LALRLKKECDGCKRMIRTLYESGNKYLCYRCYRKHLKNKWEIKNEDDKRNTKKYKVQSKSN